MKKKKEADQFKLLRICVVALCLSVVMVGQAEISVVSVDLAESVQNRSAVNSIKPRARCSPEVPNEAFLPSVSTQRIGTLYLWTKINSERGDGDSINIDWFKDGLAVRTQRTERSWRDGILRRVEWVEVGLEWKKLASVLLRIAPSSGWRTWGTKELDRHVHVGEWRVDITTIHNQVLCSVHFTVID